MNITELDSYNLADAVKFNKQLNPRLWQKEQMRPEVRDKLLEIAADFKEFLGLSDLEVKDITVSGSNAGYTYTPYSDIDLHLVVDIPQADSDDVYRELFDAKKYQYNDLHNIKIGGYDVELYVENANKPPVSQGVFSVLNNDWINIPRYRKSTVDDDAVRSKYEDFKHRIDDAVKSNDMERIDSLAKKIKTYRQAGLDAHGELGPENLAYKMLRTQGYIKKLYDARAAARDAELSLAEQNKVKKPFVYGYKSVAEDATATPDGVNPTTCMFLNEKETPTHEEIIRDFLNFAVEKLNIDRVPKLRLKKDPAWSIRNQSFGRYDNATGELIVALGNRHIMDILRTLAHELTHRKQDERETMPPGAGETGSPYENEAHAQAGVLMREYADMHPEYFQDVAVAESASGYIPTRAQAKDPRYAMALTVDIKPGQTGKEANKMALKTNKQGKPGLLMKTANMIGEAAKTKSYGYNSTPLSQVPGEREDELGNQEATGPEFEPQFPPGTTKVDVSDLTDWYRLGMDISDMDDADPEDYNQGPPQTVIVFPSDDAEQGYLKQFKRLGLKTHDMDPDVEGGEDVTGKHLNKALAEELEAFKTQDLFEVKMTSKNLAKLAKAIPGVKVGLEFEMIVPNASVDDDGELEPDYDQDERVRDIDDAVNFFDDGGYNDRSTLRRIRDDMNEAYWTWKSEKIDEEWYGGNGFEYFCQYLDREEPFDEEQAQEEATNELQTQYGDNITPEEFETMLTELVNEKQANYYQEKWDEQGYEFDKAREEFEEEKNDDSDYDEEAWLQSEGIRYASDVESNYGHVTWPYYTSNSSEGEADIERIALDFMNSIGADSVAYSSSYHGSYKKWVGNGWVLAGSNKPDDCFSIEPDGSLHGDDSDDVGLEFVSPPIPLEDIGTVMKKVQRWAADNGVYTGKSNGTSIHTNISVPDYDLDKLDYLKAALLLGDEHVLREFDRIGNTYAAPAIEKVKELVKQKPEKAKELLDKMKSQLNAAASKLIHSGQTNKFTSINTKDNRVEFRSPGGDYLSIIADNPQKMIDTINRMVVTLDAAMDPNKYKEEYQKKLYKLLTGDLGSRTAKSGDIKFDIVSKATVWDKDTRRQEPAFKTTIEATTAKEAFTKARQLRRIPEDSKMSEYNVTPTSVTRSSADKDLLKYFAQYAAGELPKAALKSFVRQAQLQRRVARQKEEGKMWWNVKRDGQRIEVVATDELDAKLTAAREWGIVASTPNLDSMSVEVLRPYDDTASGPQVVAQQPTTPAMGLWDIQANGFIDAFGGVNQGNRLIGGADFDGALEAARRNGIASRIGTGEVDIRPIPQQQPAQQGNWGIWVDGASRFARAPGEYPVGQEIPLRRFPSREAAEQFLAQTRAENPRVRADIEVREIEPTQALPDIFPDLPRPQAAQQGATSSYELYRISDGRTVTAPAGNPIQFLATDPEDAESKIARYAADFNLGAPQLFAVRSVLQVPPQYSTQFGAARGAPNWELVRDRDQTVVHRIFADTQDDAIGQASDFTRMQGWDPNQYTLQAADAAQGGLVDVATDRPATTGSFTGEWKIVAPDGTEVYRFGGVGNAQSDANRVAMAWLQRNPRHMVDGTEVVPVMG